METGTTSLWDDLYGLLLRYVKNKGITADHAQDIVQDVLIKVYENLNTLREPKKMLPWAFSIARNRVTDFYRKHRPSAVDLQHLELPTDTHEDKTVEFAECIRYFLPHLPKESQQIIVWVELDHRSQKELSEKMGLPYSTVKSKVQRARKQLRERIEACCTVQHDRFGNIMQYHKKVACC